MFLRDTLSLYRPQILRTMLLESAMIVNPNSVAIVMILQKLFFTGAMMLLIQ